MTSAQVRTELVRALKLDLVGPGITLGEAQEALPQPPSRWYLTGYLVPREAPMEQAVLLEADDEMDAPGEEGLDDDATPERGGGSKDRRLPSSIGISFLVPGEAKKLEVTIRWGNYKLSGELNTPSEAWHRTPCEETVSLALKGSIPQTVYTDIPNSGKLRLALTVQPVGPELQLAAGTRTVSVFLVNNRVPVADLRRDEAFAFQTELHIRSDQPITPRPDVRGLLADEWDERLADLQYADTGEYAVGHNVSAFADVEEDICRSVYTCWIPEAEVHRIAPNTVIAAELGMEALAALQDGAQARAKLIPMVEQYRAWIAQQALPSAPDSRKQVARELIDRANVAAKRIEAGIELLNDPECLLAFRIANRAMAKAARRRQGVMRGKKEDEIDSPKWRPFQLAFLLMNLPGIADPKNDDRLTVDLLFFPTGGGKTEAYLGLAAFTLVLRRFRNKGVTGAGLSVLMRYTLRLLTLDQLSRAATLICALEMERQLGGEADLGDWPFEIGLWVGRAATPNQMGSKDQYHPETARARTISFKNDDHKPSPIPLEECPWCGSKFGRNSFQLVKDGRPDANYPDNLVITCLNRDCEWSRGTPLPIVAVDEPLYRRLPCFVIATVDKFAGMPWTGDVGAMFGRVDRYDKAGFYGPCEPGVGTPLPGERLPAPDLIIQDELHLISGPLGTIVGLYETALEELASHDGIRPKIVASTATVRRAESQIRALFNRACVDIFPPPGPNRRDSFFANTLKPTADDEQTNPRLYIGIAAQGRSPKVAMLRVYLALLGAAQRWHSSLKQKPNPVDPYMTLLGYFNALRELGGARRLIEDEIRSRLASYGSRKRIGESTGLFGNREMGTVGNNPIELTSRENTAAVADAKRRLGLAFSEKDHVDVAIATNMISVGLDITRLGLMVIFGQPKTSAEYIQASSRVGRDPKLPGLVVSIFNVHKPRDRSHYERFAHYHETFYRSVEATSVTPFSPRALDKALAASIVALARLKYEGLTPPKGAADIVQYRSTLDEVVEHFGKRASTHNPDLSKEELADLENKVRQRAAKLLDAWFRRSEDLLKTGAHLRYNPYEPGSGETLLQEYLDPDLRKLPSYHPKVMFRANRSMRDVEPNSNLWVRNIDNHELPEDAA